MGYLLVLVSSIGYLRTKSNNQRVNTNIKPQAKPVSNQGFGLSSFIVKENLLRKFISLFGKDKKHLDYSA